MSYLNCIFTAIYLMNNINVTRIHLWTRTKMVVIDILATEPTLVVADIVAVSVFGPNVVDRPSLSGSPPLMQA